MDMMLCYIMDGWMYVGTETVTHHRYAIPLHNTVTLLLGTMEICLISTLFQCLDIP